MWKCNICEGKFKDMKKLMEHFDEDHPDSFPSFVMTYEGGERE